MRAAGIEPAQACSALRIFIPTTTFAALREQVWGLDYPFAIASAVEAFALGAARLVSTPSPAFQLELGSGLPVTGFPEFEQFYILSFLRCTQVV